MRLSICIPTHNRAAYLPALFDSILEQRGYACEIEIVVSDNASTDRTADVVARYREVFPRLVYHRAETNQGADRNFLKVVELASGDFCWLMGSDDIVEPGAIAEIDSALTAHPDVAGALVRNASYDVTMTRQIAIEGSEQAFDATTVLAGAQETFIAIGGYFGYISANVVNRSAWREAVATSAVEEYFNAWVHVYVIGRMLQLRQKWLYLAYPCVGWRCGNDSFLAEGMYQRLKIDVEGYDHVVKGLFGAGSPAHRHTMRRILPHARHRIGHAKVHDAPPAFFRQALGLLVKHYWRSPKFWLGCFPVFFVPSAVAKSAKAVSSKFR